MAAEAAEHATQSFGKIVKHGRCQCSPGMAATSNSP
jgi:hypothetical protein